MEGLRKQMRIRNYTVSRESRSCCSPRSAPSVNAKLSSTHLGRGDWTPNPGQLRVEPIHHLMNSSCSSLRMYSPNRPVWSLLQPNRRVLVSRSPSSLRRSTHPVAFHDTGGVRVSLRASQLQSWQQRADRLTARQLETKDRKVTGGRISKEIQLFTRETKA